MVKENDKKIVNIDDDDDDDDDSDYDPDKDPEKDKEDEGDYLDDNQPKLIKMSFKRKRVVNDTFASLVEDDIIDCKNRREKGFNPDIIINSNKNLKKKKKLSTNKNRKEVDIQLERMMSCIFGSKKAKTLTNDRKDSKNSINSNEKNNEIKNILSNSVKNIIKKEVVNETKKFAGQEVT
jgi:hypothetical protein